MSGEIHSTLISVGDAMLVAPAQSLVAVVNPQTLKPSAMPGSAYLGTVETETGTVPVVAGEAIIGRQSQPINTRCRIAILRPPGTRDDFGVLARAYPLVVGLSGGAFTPVSGDVKLPDEGILSYGNVGRRFTCLPDLPFWAQQARSLQEQTRASA